MTVVARMDIISTLTNIIVGTDQLTLRFIAIIALLDLDTYFNAPSDLFTIDYSEIWLCS